MEEPRPVKIDVSRDPGRYFSDPYSDLARNYPGERIVVHVPFEGDAGLFKLRPSSFTTVWPRGQVTSDELLLTIDYPQDQTPNVDGPTQEFIRRVGQYLEWSRQQIESFNRSLEQDARRAIDARRQRLSSATPSQRSQRSRCADPATRRRRTSRTCSFDGRRPRCRRRVPTTSRPSLSRYWTSGSSNTSSALSVCRPGRWSRAPSPTPAWARRIAARRSWRRSTPTTPGARRRRVSTSRARPTFSSATTGATSLSASASSGRGRGLR